eukprot:SAG11_NODE_1255_length_5375_cov_2.966641_9_plen_135_part_00
MPSLAALVAGGGSAAQGFYSAKFWKTEDIAGRFFGMQLGVSRQKVVRLALGAFALSRLSSHPLSALLMAPAYVVWEAFGWTISKVGYRNCRNHPPCSWLARACCNLHSRSLLTYTICERRSWRRRLGKASGGRG